MQSLAVDHFSLISAFLDSHSISKLYACGDTKLSRTLVLAVKHLEFNLRRLTRLYWPSIISQFPRLISLVISLPDVHKLAISGVDLSSLPSTLEKLVLDYPEGFRSLIEDIGPVPGSTRPPLKLGKIRHLATCTPNLKHLEWHKGAFLSSNEGQNDFLSSLPPQLEWLSLASLCHLNINCLSYLPSNLQHLTLSLAEVEENDETFSWPPFLTYLKLTQQFGGTVSRLLENMPTTLTELKLNTERLAADDVKALPRSLLRLDLRLLVFSSHEASLLPPRLVHLKVRVSDYRADAIKCLPRTLTSYNDTCFSLSPNPLKMPSIQCLDDFPPDMQEMPLWAYGPTARSFWHRLPRTLRQQKGYSLHLQANRFPDPSVVSKLPPNITDIMVYGPTQPILQNLPMNLTTLLLGDSLQIVVEPIWLNQLPFLTSLECQQGVSINLAGFTQVTLKRLQKLSLQKLFCFENLNLTLPCFQGLHTLSVRPTLRVDQEPTLSPVTREEFAVWDAETEAASKFIKSFPKSTHTLEYCNNASGSLIQLLPTSITSLTFYLFLNCPLSQVLSSLPPNIAILDFPAIDIVRVDLKLSEDVLNNIPHSLHSLSLAETNTPALLDNLQPLKASRPWLHF